jgi:hypothetical protein
VRAYGHESPINKAVFRVFFFSFDIFLVKDVETLIGCGEIYACGGFDEGVL